jgi:hypothetical protein
VRRFIAESELAESAAELSAWHLRPGALQRLLPPWLPVRVKEPGAIRSGERLTLAIGPGPFALDWVAEHRDVEPGVGFRDVQLRGPFGAWSHLHRFVERGEGSLLRDEIVYALPGGALGDAVLGNVALRSLVRNFRFRHRRTRDDLERHRAQRGERPLRVAVTGATGLVGRALCAYLEGGGHEVRRITRNPRRTGDVRWDPAAKEIDSNALDGIDAVIHLAGESVFGLGWSDAKKRAIRESRVRSTKLLAERIAARASAPPALIVASASGFYGDRGSERLDESAESGDGFLAEVCRDWEAAADPARQAGARVASVRTGMVLSGRGAALATMRLPFEAGLGGPLGSGEQFMSWIALDDLLGIYELLLVREDLSGAFNATAPAPLTNLEFTRTLGAVLRRPTVVPAPAAALRAALGQLADELLLASQRLVPARLDQAGFRFGLPDLATALRLELGRLREEDAPVRIESD